MSRKHHKPEEVVAKLRKVTFAVLASSFLLLICGTIAAVRQ
jgi:hypothetical protein